MDTATLTACGVGGDHATADRRVAAIGADDAAAVVRQAARDCEARQTTGVLLAALKNETPPPRGSVGSSPI